MTLELHENCLGFELHDGERFAALYRVREELPRTESPKPCFAPIYTRSGNLVTEYRPADHAWHTGLYFGWVHANGANLWGGNWFLPETGTYEHVPDSHGVQRHDRFTGERGGAGDVSDGLGVRVFHARVLEMAGGAQGVEVFAHGRSPIISR